MSYFHPVIQNKDRPIVRLVLRNYLLVWYNLVEFMEWKEVYTIANLCRDTYNKFSKSSIGPDFISFLCRRDLSKINQWLKTQTLFVDHKVDKWVQISSLYSVPIQYFDNNNYKRFDQDRKLW